MTKESLYQLQEDVLGHLQSITNGQLTTFKLCGGTALARCWLDHRISYDLDFFLPYGFNALLLSKELKSAGIQHQTISQIDDHRKANQLHCYIIDKGRSLKVSFIEDAYFDLFPTIQKPFGALSVKTEDIAGLYHRKLRTVSGSGAEGDSFEGGRQKARDLFDLHVLSKTHMPILQFTESLPYQFPSDAFINGLISMPWHELADELSEIICAEQWQQAKDIGFIQESLFEQIGAVAIADGLEDEDGLEDQDKQDENNSNGDQAKATGSRRKPPNGGMKP